MTEKEPAQHRLDRRELNDSRRQLFASSATIAFICECDDPGCFTTIPLTAGEFDQARHHEPRLLLAPGHTTATAAPAPPPVGEAARQPRG